MSAIDYAPSWKRSAPCAQVGGDMWFPEKGANADAREAKRICRRCPWTAECIQLYIDAPSEPVAGIWGGYTTRELRPLRQQARAASGRAA